MRPSVDALLSRGEALFQDDVEGALALFEEVLATHPDHVQALNDAGVAYFQVRRLHDARRVLERALALAPDDNFAVLNLFHVHMALQQYDEATRLLQEHHGCLTRADLDQLLAHLGRACPAGAPQEAGSPQDAGSPQHAGSPPAPAAEPPPAEPAPGVPDKPVAAFTVAFAGRTAAFRLALDCRHFSQKLLWDCHAAGELHEPGTAFFFAAVLRKGDTVIDVGGHVGYFALLAASAVGEHGRVLTFEPEASNFENLRANVALNGFRNVTATHALVGPQDGDATFYVNADNDGGHALWDVGAHSFNQKSRERVERRALPMRSLDGFLAEHPVESVRLVKIDTEGAELGVLRGAVHTLARHRVPFIVAEINHFGLQQMGTSEAELRAFMREQGYATYFLPDTPPGSLVELPPGVEVQVDQVFNVVFARREAVAGIPGFTLTHNVALASDDSDRPEAIWLVSIHHHGERIRAMRPGPPDDRDLRAGYLRGCGLQFGNLRTLCERDPLYVRAHAAARARSLVTDENLMNLFVLLKFHAGRLAPGHIVEFGTYRGGSAIFMAMVARELLPGTRVMAFDTFEGMPDTDGTRDAHKPGDFGDAVLDEIRGQAASLGLDNLELVQGRFEDTCEAALGRLGAVRLAHIDCDIHSGVQTAYDGCRKIFVPGAYVVFDDPLTSSCLGAFEAVEDLLVRRDGLNAEQVYPHLVFRHRAGH